MTPEQTLRELFSQKFPISIDYPEAPPQHHTETFWNIEVENRKNRAIVKNGAIFDFFLAQFDEMLREDIEALSSMRMPVPDNALAQYAQREAMGFNAGLNRATDILEARREALKK